VAYIDGVAYPGRGRTRLALAGEGLVCASPTDIYVLPRWGAEVKHIFDLADCLFDIAVVDSDVHWWQMPSATNQVDRMGTIALSGGEASGADIAKEGPSPTIAYVPPADAVVVGTLHGLRGFSRDTGSFDFSVETDKVLVLAADDSAVFCALHGRRPLVVDGVEGLTNVQWLGRIPFSTIVAAKAAR